MSTAPIPSPTKSTALDGRYLTFRLGAESYGIDVMKVQEIIRLEPITAVPQLPAHLRGVINLRGRIVPVVDLRIRFGLPKTEDGERTCIIVVQVAAARGHTPMGLVVDAVEEVLNIGKNDAAPPPEFGCAVDMTFLRGMARVRNEVKTLLDIDRVLGGDELATAIEAAA